MTTGFQNPDSAYPGLQEKGIKYVVMRLTLSSIPYRNAGL